MHEPTDEELIQQIKGKTEARNKALKYLFQNKSWRDSVKKYVHLMNGDETEAMDIFKDAIIILDKNIRAGSFTGKNKMGQKTELKTYFIGISKNCWRTYFYKKNREKPAQQPVNLEKTDGKTVEYQYIGNECKDSLRTVIQQLGEKCQKLLQYYMLSYNMSEIAEKMNYNGKDTAKAKVYECRKKARTYLAQRPKLQETLKECYGQFL